MSKSSDPLDELRRRVERIEDRASIVECIARHARGCDRHDLALLTSAYLESGFDEHGASQLHRGHLFAAWANDIHAQTSQAHLHHITTHSCEVDGDVAHADSYVIVTLLSPDGGTVTVICGRYIDRLERDSGNAETSPTQPSDGVAQPVWRLALRRCTVEMAFTANASLLHSPYFTNQGYIRGTRDTTDPSYARPLDIETEVRRWGNSSTT